MLSTVGFCFLSCVLLVFVFAVVNQCREDRELLKRISLPLITRAVRRAGKNAHGPEVIRPQGKVNCATGNSAVTLAVSAHDVRF